MTAQAACAQPPVRQRSPRRCESSHMAWLAPARGHDGTAANCARRFLLSQRVRPHNPTRHQAPAFARKGARRLRRSREAAGPRTVLPATGRVPRPLPRGRTCAACPHTTAALPRLPPEPARCYRCWTRFAALTMPPPGERRSARRWSGRHSTRMDASDGPLEGNPRGPAAAGQPATLVALHRHAQTHGRTLKGNPRPRGRLSCVPVSIKSAAAKPQAIVAHTSVKNKMRTHFVRPRKDRG